MKKHKWSKEDDIVTFYLYKYGADEIPYSLSEISRILGMSVASLRMRIANFKALDKGNGLTHYAKLSEKIYNQYKNYSRSDLRAVIIEILSTKELERSYGNTNSILCYYTNTLKRQASIRFVLSTFTKYHFWQLQVPYEC